uniref:RxLR effector candidate protein n=1 Tax=Hyaloperonospora arabidopsidis (strain Emoy2) TaxID=559515 RepID=M4C3Q0_HYAAE|nr:RxLR effector candidate protein [Hyaloperonospora arabidopsidis Emoy2]
MRLPSLALLTFAAIVVRGTDSLGTSGNRTTNVSLPDSIRSLNNSLGGTHFMLLAEADEDATTEERVLDIPVVPRVKVVQLVDMVHAHKPTPLALSDCEKYLRKIADRNAITYYLHSLKETYEQMEKRLITIIDSVKSTWSDDIDMINKGRAMLEEVDKVQNVRREKMQTGELHPVEVIEMIILDARVQAAEAKVAKNGMVGNRQHLFKEVNLGDLEKYIEAFNTRKGTALTLPGVLFEGFGSVADLTSFLFMVKRNDFKKQNAKAVLDTLNVLFAGWPRDSKTIKEDTAVTLEIPRQAKGIRQKTKLLIGYISALVISNRITQHDMATLLVDIFGVQRASLLIDRVEKVDPNFKDYRLKMELDEIKKERYYNDIDWRGQKPNAQAAEEVYRC